MSRESYKFNARRSAQYLLTHRRRALQRRFVETGADPTYRLAFGQKELGFESNQDRRTATRLRWSTGPARSCNCDAEDPVLRRLFQERRSALPEPLKAGEPALGAGRPGRAASLISSQHHEQIGRSRFRGALWRSCTFERIGSRVLALRVARTDLGQHRARETEEKRLQGLAHYDALTGLPNRLLLNDRFNVGTCLRAAARRAAWPSTFVNIDKFKAINDAHGHLAGDEVLRTVARRAQQGVPRERHRRPSRGRRIHRSSGAACRPKGAPMRWRRACAANSKCVRDRGLAARSERLHRHSVFPRDGQDQRTRTQERRHCALRRQSRRPGFDLSILGRDTRPPPSWPRASSSTPHTQKVWSNTPA